MTLGWVRRRITTALTFVALGLTAFAATQHRASAASSLLAVTGDLQPGATGAELLGISGATLNEAGQVAVRVALKLGVGPIDAANDRSVWRIAGSTRELLAQSGVGGVPSGGSFDVFQAASIGDSGQVVVRASIAGGQAGIWRYPPSPGAGSRVAVTGVTGLPDLPNAKFETIGFQLLHAAGDVLAINGNLAHGFGGVNGNNDVSLFLDVDGQQSLLAREQFTPAPGLGGAPFRSPTAVGVNNQAQVVIQGTLVDGIDGVTSADNSGIWRMSASGGDLVARRGVGNVAGVPVASFSAFIEPRINNSGLIAFGAELNLGGDVTLANGSGIWLHDGPAGELLARSGEAAPGIAGASFRSFEAPLLNDGGQVLFSASLVEGAGGVTAQNADGLWVADADECVLIARIGSAGVPGVSGASFASFGALAFNELGIAAVQANLAGVAPGTEQGLWLMNATGGGVLVARTGETVGTRTISALEFTGGSGGGDGRQRALNSSGQLVYKATFTNGDEGLFLYSVATAAADFNLDGRVDGADLLNWKIGFGQSAGAGRAQGNADGDGDVDGGDFLLWQQQLNASVPFAVIPEPRYIALLLPAGLAHVLRFSRGARSVLGTGHARNPPAPSPLWGRDRWVSFRSGAGDKPFHQPARRFSVVTHAVQTAHL